MPIAASMSSLWGTHTAGYCTDGNEGASTHGICHTQAETAPWLALDYGSEFEVSSVVLVNRIDARTVRTKNVNIRVSSTPPVSGSEMFTGGQLLGTFVGPATSGQTFEVTGATPLTGRYVVVQMDHTSGAQILNLCEVTAWGQGTKIN